MQNLNRIFKFFDHLAKEYPECNIKGSCQWNQNRDGIIEVEFYHNNMMHSKSANVRGTGDQAITKAIDSISNKIVKYFDEYNERMDERACYLAMSPEEKQIYLDERVERAMRALKHIQEIMDSPE